MTGQLQQEYSSYKNHKVNMLQSFNANALFNMCLNILFHVSFKNLGVKNS